MSYEYSDVREYAGGLIFNGGNTDNRTTLNADTLRVTTSDGSYEAFVGNKTDGSFPGVSISSNVSGGTGGAYLGNASTVSGGKTYPICGVYAYSEVPAINYAVQPFDFHVNSSGLKYSNTPGENPLIQKISDSGLIVYNSTSAANKGTVLQMASGGVNYIQLACVAGTQGENNPILGLTVRNKAGTTSSRMRWDGLSVAVANGESCKVVTDGLYLDDGAGNTCYLKFEGGKLLINGKEIATKE